MASFLLRSKMTNKNYYFLQYTQSYAFSYLLLTPFVTMKCIQTKYQQTFSFMVIKTKRTEKKNLSKKKKTSEAQPPLNQRIVVVSKNELSAMITSQSLCLYPNYVVFFKISFSTISPE